MSFNCIKAVSNEKAKPNGVWIDENCEEILKESIESLASERLIGFEKCGDSWFPYSCIHTYLTVHESLLTEFGYMFQYCVQKNLKKNKLSNCQQKFFEKQINLVNKLEKSQKTKTFFQKIFGQCIPV